jgi:FhuF 2Fe-2S C-terminal domain
LGGFFTAQTHSDGESPEGKWRSLRELTEDPAPLDARVEYVHATLRAARPDAPKRVAASVVHLGVVARILAPALAIEAAGWGAVSPTGTDLWWQDDLGGVYPLSLTTTSVESDLLDGAVSELTDLIGSRYGVPSRALWGNIASAANSAAHQFATARPDLTEPARAVAEAVLADHRVDGGNLHSGPGFRRRSCCLIYQATGARVAVCGDCVLGRKVRRYAAGQSSELVEIRQ